MANLGPGSFVEVLGEVGVRGGGYGAEMEEMGRGRGDGEMGRC